jgi:predicted SnoaL-like aldol condensation-catalyzing enzyme
MINFLKTLPLPVEKTSPVKLILADGDFVAGLMHISLMGKQMFVVDLFRIKDGQLAEHWDAVQDTTDTDFNETVINPAIDADINKELVRARYKCLDKYQIHKVIGEGDIVIAQLEFVVDDQRFVRYDILRVGDKIDQIISIQQKVPDAMMHNNGMF